MFTGAVLLSLRSELRGRVGSLIALALVVACGAGSSLGAFSAAQRTDTAYAEYVRAAEVSDLTINPSMATLQIDQAIRAFPGVTALHSDALLLATVSETASNSFLQILGVDRSLQVRGSTDGRYIDVDRPVVVEGDLARNEREVFVSEDYHAALEKAVGRRLDVGDVIDVAFWWAGYEVIPPGPDDVITPIGVEPLRIAGFGHLPDEVLPDELYPRDRLIVSADIAARYGCLADFDVGMSQAEAYAAAFPPGCARQYQYYALTLDGTTGRASTIQQAFTRAAEELTAELPPAVRQDAGYFYVAQARDDVDDAVAQTTRPTVTTFVVFGIVSGAATLAIVALVVARTFRRDDSVRQIWMALGATTAQSARAAAASPLLALTIGTMGAAGVGYLLSPIGPFGSVRVVQPSVGFRIDTQLLVTVLVVFEVAVVAIVGILAFLTIRSTSRRRSIDHKPSRAVGLAARGNKPAIAVGVQASLDPGRAGANLAVLGGAVVAVVAGVAAIIFGTNLSNLVDEPRDYGWPWDAAVITGGGYGDTDVGRADNALADHPDVVDHAFFAFDSSSRVADQPVTALFGIAGDDVPFPIVAGRAPLRPGEATVGAATADELDIEIGDRVSLQSYLFAVDEIEIVGTSVLPSLGSFLSDRIGLGRGAYILVDDEQLTEVDVSLTAIRLRDGTDPETFLAGIDDLSSWDVLGAPPYTYTAPVRPPEIIDVSSMRGAPLVVGGLLAAALAVGLGLSMAVSVRDRHRELAILRALGFNGAQLRSTVRWQAISSVAVGIVVGLPLGIVFGRWIWQSFAGRLGVVARPEIPVAWLTLVLIVVILVTQFAAAIPARGASRVNPSAVLRGS